MAFTPVEIRHDKRAAVDKTLTEITVSFEDVWRERADLADRVEALETELARLHEREELLKETLIAAERNAAEVKATAQKQADLSLAEAHSEARSITRGAQGERERLITEARRVRALLRSALDIVEEAHAPAEDEQQAELQAGQAVPPAEPWPRHDDTREFGGSQSGHIRSA